MPRLSNISKVNNISTEKKNPLGMVFVFLLNLVMRYLRPLNANSVDCFSVRKIINQNISETLNECILISSLRGQFEGNEYLRFGLERRTW